MSYIPEYDSHLPFVALTGNVTMTLILFNAKLTTIKPSGAVRKSASIKYFTGSTPYKKHRDKKVFNYDVRASLQQPNMRKKNIQIIQ